MKDSVRLIWLQLRERCPGIFGAGFVLCFTILLGSFTGCKTADPILPLSEAAAASSGVVKINPGDLVQISFPASPQNNTSQRVRLDGKIQLPLVGDVPAAGRTPKELQEDLTQLYSKQLQINEVLVVLGSSSASIFVSGAVNHPGRITMERPMTVLDAIMEAGGFDPRRANMKKVFVIRKEGDRYVRYPMDLRPLIEGKKDAKPFKLEPFDIIFVKEKIL